MNDTVPPGSGSSAVPSSATVSRTRAYSDPGQSPRPFRNPDAAEDDEEKA
ncbi:hypothetical protein [Streptomyces sp. NPDC051994]